MSTEFKVGGLERELRMRWFSKEKEEKIDEGRRKFLRQGKNLGIAAAGIALGLTPQKAEAINFSYNELPPGFQIVKDKDLVTMFAMLYLNRFDTDLGLHISERMPIIKKSLLGQHTHYITGVIKSQTPLTEPAYWFTLEYFNYFYGKKSGIYIPLGGNEMKEQYKKIKTQNPAMYNWILGISWYFTNWLWESKKEPQKVEEHLTKSIILAAGRNDDYKTLVKAIENQDNQTYVQGLLSSLEKRSYEDKLIAAWSSFMYVNNEAKKLNDKGLTEKGKNMNNLIEIPLRKYIPKIRGPPYYNI